MKKKISALLFFAGTFTVLGMASPVSLEEESEQGTCVWSTACGLPVLLCGEDFSVMQKQQIEWEKILGCRPSGGEDESIN